MKRSALLTTEQILPTFKSEPYPSAPSAWRLGLCGPAAAHRVRDPRFWLAGELVVSAETFSAVQSELVGVAWHRHSLLEELAQAHKDLAQVRRQLELATAVEYPQDKA